MRIEGYIEKLLNIYHSIYTTSIVTLDGDGFHVYSDTNDTICTNLGGFIEFIENEIKEAIFNAFINGQYTELIDIIDTLDNVGR